MMARTIPILFLIACASKGGSGPPNGSTDGGTGSGSGSGSGDFGSPDAGSSAVLTGTVYFIPDTTTKFPDVSTMPPQGTLYATQLNIPPQDWQKSIIGDRLEWFAIRYTGIFNAVTTGDYKFRLYSDDGSLLYVDGNKVIDDDGLHSGMEVIGTVNLAAGSHKVQVDYFQGPRYFLALQLWMTPPGGTEDFFHPSAPF